MNFNKNKNNYFNSLEKGEGKPKLQINTTAKPIEIPYVEPPLTARKDINNLQTDTNNFIIDNITLYNKLQDVQDEIRELRNIINSLHFPKPVKYNYPNCSSYSPNTMYCTPPLETNIKNYFKG